MTEIDKINRYIERTKVRNMDSYRMNLEETFELYQTQKAFAVNQARVLGQT